MFATIWGMLMAVSSGNFNEFEPLLDPLVLSAPSFLKHFVYFVCNGKFA
ncbi:MAG: hypothetical protein H6568_11460 [Lewinellaceae bacterium]|nr:hypothetical protein [Lewinellaceae bacterium]